MSDVTALGDRFIATYRGRYRVQGQDHQAAVILDRATGRAFTVIADAEVQARVIHALNLWDSVET